MVEDYYKRFQYTALPHYSDYAYIGLATFTSERQFYPRTAVVKCLSKNQSMKAVHIREVMVTKTLQNLHRNLAKLYCYYETGYYYVMFLEHCERGSIASLFDSMSSQGRVWSEEELMRWFVQVASAVVAMHQRQYVHRDIKPQNIFMTSTGDLKLGDFGEAKKAKDQETEVRGTHQYMPYTLRARRELGIQLVKESLGYVHDVWSLGKTFYEMCLAKYATDLDARIDAGQEFLSLVQYELQIRQYSAGLIKLIQDMLCTERTSEEVLTELNRLICHTSLISLKAIPSEDISDSIFASIRSLPTEKCAYNPSHQEDVRTLRCTHKVCRACLGQYIDQLADEGRLLGFENCTCPICATEMSIRTVIQVANEETLKELELLERKNNCPKCGSLFYVFRREGNVVKPYAYKCPNCKKAFCTFCCPKKHEFLGMSVPCNRYKMRV